MSDKSLQTQTLHRLILFLREGNQGAKEELIHRIERRLRWLCRKTLLRFPLVSRHEQTDAIFNGAAMRLLQSLKDIQPESVRQFLGLMAVAVRRELLDLTKYYKAQCRQPAGKVISLEEGMPAGQPDPLVSEDAAAKLERWSAFHEAASELPPEEREAFGLVYYNGLSSVEAAEALGISARTVDRRWGKACLKLREQIGADYPD